MGLLLALAGLYLPGAIRKRKLEQLFRVTAEAFQATAPPTRTLSHRECLRQYALFTRRQADIAIRQRREAEVAPRLFQKARRIGEQLRSDFRMGDEDVMDAVKVIYRLIGIDARGKKDGDIVVSRCLFSDYYTADVCRLVSSLDEGLFAGLTGGASLTFYARITDGSNCCRARLATVERVR